jgi:protein-ribulosamine 3-kinase
VSDAKAPLAAVAAALAEQGVRVAAASARPVGGGCIHDTWRLDGPAGPAFLKTHREAGAWLLEAEADGLAALAACGELRVPAVLGTGVADGTAWLALEWLELRAPTPASEAALGAALARQHLVPGPWFGWPRGNAIGATLQRNTPGSDWAQFFAAERIGFQLELGARAGWPRRLLADGERLCARITEMLADRRPSPALLHGDLWSGNRAADADGRPVVFDPAVHYGDPECDLAMTRLFGGFAAGFYAAYDAVLPPAPGRMRREPLYRLYHVLNHANLFGGSYVRETQALIGRLLSE